MNLDEMMERQAQRIAEENQPAPENAESAVEETVENTEANETETPNPEVESGTEEATPSNSEGEPAPAAAEPVEAAVDYNKFLEESSEGLFKSTDDFKASLSKVKEYDEIKAKYEAKEAEMSSISPFAKKLIELERSGKTQDQIDTFIKLNRLGDLAQLDPKEIKIERLVFEGWKREAAERKVVREFNLDISLDEDVLTEEELQENRLLLEDKKEELRMASKADLEFLQEMVAKSELVDDDAANTKILQEKASKLEYEKKLAPVAAQVAKEFVSNKSISFANGKDQVSYELPYSEGYDKYVTDTAKSYFLETDIPVNDANVATFKNLMKGEFLVENLETKILPNVFGDGYSKGYEAAKAELENRSGLPVSGLPPVNNDSAEAMREQQRRVASGED